jgi:hypothetical protein
MNDEHQLDERLPYATQPMYFPNGASVEEFIIPEEDREIVLEQLYPFSPIPQLTDEMYDIHAERTFIVKDFRVTWEHGMNFLVSPYYPESGGTVIDWWSDELAEELGFDEKDFDDDDFELPEIDDDDIPF